MAPNADPGQIRWRYQGARDLAIDPASGDLRITLHGPAARRARTLTEHAPVAWQEIGGVRVAVAARFALAADGSVGFGLGSYDHSLPLTIDPSLTYSTYHGGSSTDKANAIAIDSTGNAYITGYTASSSSFPLQGALDASYNSNTDAFVSKLNAAGSALLYSTYIGGGQSDKGNTIALDSSNNIYITGQTESGAPTPFPTSASGWTPALAAAPAAANHVKTRLSPS